MIVQAQTPGLSFGARIDIRLESPPVSVAFVRPDSAFQSTIAVGSARHARLEFLDFRSHGGLARTRRMTAPFPPAFLKQISTRSGLLFLSDASGERFALWDVDTGFRLFNSLPGQTDAILSDIDNDGNEDLLVFGRGTPGVQLIHGNGKKNFAGRDILFPDLSVGDLAVTDINGDDIPDVILIDWLSNCVHLFTGIGENTFSEQVSYSLPGEPASMCITGPDELRRVRLAVTLPDLEEIRLYQVSPFGDFRPEAVLRCGDPPRTVSLIDLNDDGVEEIITAVQGGLLVFVPGIEQRSYSPVLFAIGTGLDASVLGDVDGNGRCDAVLASTEGRSVTLLSNNAANPAFNWPDTYGVGAGPEGLCISDFNGDRAPDLVVANSLSSSISFLANRGKGMLDGQMTVPVSEMPSRVYATAREQMRPTFVVSHRSSEMVTVVRWENASSVSTFTIPTERNPSVIFAEAGPDQMLSFLTRSPGGKGKGLSLSLFDQISNDQFIETTLSPNLPGQVSAITAHDMNGDGFRDLIFSTYRSITQGAMVFTSKAVGRFTFDKPEPLYTFPDSLASISFIKAADLDGNDFPDLLLGRQSAEPALVILFRSGSGSTISTITIPGVWPADEESLIIEDLNGDGVKDLCILDSLTESVIAWYSLPRRFFEQKTRICPARGVSAIATSSLKKRGVTDLVMSYRSAGTVSILFNPF